MHVMIDNIKIYDYSSMYSICVYVYVHACDH